MRAGAAGSRATGAQGCDGTAVSRFRFPGGSMLKRFSRPLFLASLALLAGCAVTPRAPLRQLCILHTNDVHGHITEERVEGWRKPSGGAATLASCVREIREENRAAGIPTLLLDAGDIFLGTPEGNVSKGIAVVETMNAAGYDAMAIGNHEFDFGVGVVEALAAAARFPILGANVRVSSGGPAAVPAPGGWKDADG